MSKRTAVIADPDDRASGELVRLLDQLGLAATACKTASDTLGKLDKGADVLFLDLRSAELRGGQILQDVRERYPTIPVVICTADGRKEDVVFALRHGCMDWVDKPATKQTIGDALKRVARETRRQVSAGVASAPPAQARGLIKEIIGRIKDGSIALPEMPRVLDELQRLLANLNVSPEEVLRVLEKDPAIAAKILATANTATYGGRGRITDLKSAVTRLGNRTISSIAQTAALRGMFSFKLPAFRAVFQKMWTGHCVAAYLARELAAEVGDSDPEEVYLISLLHNSGEQFMLRVFAEIFQRQTQQILSMEEVLGAIRDTHAVFGSSLAKKWNMGPQFELIARHHHDDNYERSEFDTRTRRILHLCNVADRLVDEKGMGFYNESLPGPDLTTSYDALRISDGRKPHFAERLELIRADVAVIS
jgi:HD-like signal output (HDOD) protein/ActR/RegA family two-component response regulator